MNAKRILACLAISVSVALSGSAAATGMPVIDIANLAQDIQQFTQLAAQLVKLEQTLAQAQQQYQSITGSRSMGRSEEHTSELQSPA